MLWIRHQQLMVLSSHLRTEGNSSRPAFRLPSELLVTIFIYGARDYYESDDGGHFTPHMPAWVNVSYICRHWRNIALNSPILWAYHFNTSLRWTQELLLRSKQALLKIHINPHHQHPGLDSWWSGLLNNLLKHSERIQELHLHVPPSSLPPRLFLCAPHLEKLEVNIPGGQAFEIIDGDKLPLHTLKLANYWLPWHLFNLSRLKTLVLCNAWSDSPLNILKLLTALSSMQSISLLHLEYSLPEAHDFLSHGGLDTSPKINLPYLVDLKVVEPLSAVVVLLSCVSIPPRTQLHLSPVFEPGSSISNYVPISLFLAQQQSSSAIFHSLVFDVSSSNLTFSLPPDPLTEDMGMGYNAPLQVSLEEYFKDEDFDESEGLLESERGQIMHDICCSLPLTNIQHLHIILPEILEPDICRDILGHLGALQYMKLSDGFMPDLSLLSLTVPKSNEDLGRQYNPGQESTAGHMFMPALEKLELYQIMFAANDTSAERSGTMSQRAFFDALSTRKRLQVTMTECSVDGFGSSMPDDQYRH